MDFLGRSFRCFFCCCCCCCHIGLCLLHTHTHIHCSGVSSFDLQKCYLVVRISPKRAHQPSFIRQQRIHHAWHCIHFCLVWGYVVNSQAVQHKRKYNGYTQYTSILQTRCEYVRPLHVQYISENKIMKFLRLLWVAACGYVYISTRMYCIM